MARASKIYVIEQDGDLAMAFTVKRECKEWLREWERTDAPYTYVHVLYDGIPRRYTRVHIAREFIGKE